MYSIVARRWLDICRRPITVEWRSYRYWQMNVVTAKPFESIIGLREDQHVFHSDKPVLIPVLLEP